MSVNVEKHVNILNIISRYLFLIFISIGAMILILSDPLTKNIMNNDYCLDYVELQSTYKNCIIIDKKIKNDKFFINIRNPVTNKEEIVSVKDYVYYKVYFVGDTIK